ncbi:hypothetical protein NLJ89_g8094 [Agrocybe chaxingu]|uniref:C3H1-type domain-containing protein n=1 Tax=Agrocybe chaxingu TaxID=84603 RepID=A0A9W8MUU1_9AGAR|nr:hypothetical protein NLJ89_g8094 [Agrocybe chaxingu]
MNDAEGLVCAQTILCSTEWSGTATVSGSQSNRLVSGIGETVRGEDSGGEEEGPDYPLPPLRSQSSPRRVFFIFCALYIVLRAMTQDDDPQRETPSVNPTDTSGDVGDAKSQETARVRSQLQRILEQFRAGGITKFQTSTQIIEELDKWSGASDDERQRALTSYLEELNTEPARGADESERSQGHPKLVGKRHREEVEDLVEQLSKGENEAESDGEDERPSSRRRVKEEDMPWFNVNTVDNRRPSCIKTCQTLRVFGSDLPGSKTLLRTAQGLPDGIPLSQWDQILRGESVDLNQFFASKHCIQLDAERRGRLGDTEIVFAVPDGKRQVRNGSDWREELDDYEEHIEDLFAAKQDSAHGRVILFDTSVRNLVGGGQNTLLTDYDRFRNLAESILHADGVEYASAGTSSSKRGGETKGGNSKQGGSGNRKKLEICKRFNGDRGCEYDEDSCYYKHVCQACGNKGHGKSKCTSESDLSSTTAEWTETADPLPRPPVSALSDPVVAKTIQDNPHLFKIVSPIKVDIFESYLSDHPNQPFVQSIIMGLREGFWPWADTCKAGYPTINDCSKASPKDEGKAAFLKNQLKIELEKDRFSPSFGKDLLPGMYSMPIFAVPKPDISDYRLITDQSHGPHSLNSMIHHPSVTGYPLDNLKHFGEMLIDLQMRAPDKEKVVWKSDITEAYRIIPIHPFWQIKQVTRIDGECYVDRNNEFGNCASGALFIAFNSLVGWIAKRKKGLTKMGTYVDDSWGCGLACDMLTILLSLWDELGVPHKERKQVFGSPLTVIGIQVDPNLMSFTLPDAARDKLVKELDYWCGEKRKERLKRWYELGGWVNWALNAYPLLRPMLNNFYPKLVGRKDSTSCMWVNNSIREDFRWGRKLLDNSSGVFLLRSLSWDVEEATFVVYCDACPKGMGFWYPNLKLGFYSPTPAHTNPTLIFYFEALCVLSALYDVHLRSPRRGDGRFVIFTDNSNTVDIFNSLRALPAYNHLLKAAVDILLFGDHSLRILPEL